jgi:hypothetical protein
MERSNPTPSRYSESQILCGLREVWPGISGSGDEIRSATRIDEHLKEAGMWEEIDFEDVCRELEHFFGFECAAEAWREFFGFELAQKNPAEWETKIAPRITFGALAGFIADRTTGVAFEPVTFFGRDCHAGGVFLAMEKVAKAVRPDSKQFAPSSRIIDVFRGHALDKFWTRLRWISENKIPELPSAWRHATGAVVGIGILSLLVSFAVWYASGSAMPTISVVAVAMLAFLISEAITYAINPLPREIDNFRDLAVFIAKSGHDTVGKAA